MHTSGEAHGKAVQGQLDWRLLSWVSAVAFLHLALHPNNVDLNGECEEGSLSKHQVPGSLQPTYPRNLRARGWELFVPRKSTFKPARINPQVLDICP